MTWDQLPIPSPLKSPRPTNSTQPNSTKPKVTQLNSTPLNQSQLNLVIDELSLVLMSLVEMRWGVLSYLNPTKENYTLIELTLQQKYTRFLS